MFADPVINRTRNLAAVNSINWARILAQITYYFHAYFSLARSSSFSDQTQVRFVVPTGNFGDVLAGYFAKRMGLPVEKLIVATNENDILYRFWRSGHYEKKAVHGVDAEGGLAEDGVQAHPDGVKETLSPAMDILVSSNFERLLWYLAFEVCGLKDVGAARKTAGTMVADWLHDLKSQGGFGVDQPILELARRDFESERVSDTQTAQTIKDIFASTKPSIPKPTANGDRNGTALNGSTESDDEGYVLDPHSAIGVAAALRSIARYPPPSFHHVALATAHPAKFAHAVDLALHDEAGFSFEAMLPPQFVGLEHKEKRIQLLPRGQGWEGVRELIEAS